MTATYEQYQQEMVAYAKEVQGDNYPGDSYYIQDCWMKYWEDGSSAKSAVLSDMEYWDE